MKVAFDYDLHNNTPEHPQINRVYTAFYQRPRTMFETSRITGVPRANICRLKRRFECAGLLRCSYIGVCPITKHAAGFYTTNPNYYTMSNNKNPKPRTDENETE